MGRGKSWFMVVIIGKFDWKQCQGHGKIYKNAGPLKTKNLGNLEFTLISDYKTKSYVISMRYGEVHGK